MSSENSNATEKVVYDDKVVRWFVIASLVWGVVGMLVGVWIALELAWWPANVSRYLTFGRLRPIHTDAVIFAFAGNAVFAAVYYSTQRLLKTRMFHDALSQVHFWGWQLIIVLTAVTIPLGITQGKEYAEMEWPRVRDVFNPRPFSPEPAALSQFGGTLLAVRGLWLVFDSGAVSLGRTRGWEVEFTEGAPPGIAVQEDLFA